MLSIEIVILPPPTDVAGSVLTARLAAAIQPELPLPVDLPLLPGAAGQLTAVRITTDGSLVGRVALRMPDDEANVE